MFDLFTLLLIFTAISVLDELQTLCPNRVYACFQKLLKICQHNSPPLLCSCALNLTSKKQQVVASLSTKAEYKAMAVTHCEVPWLLQLFEDFGVKNLKPIDLRCDNQVALYIAINPIYHERMKHVEVDYHFICD